MLSEETLERLSERLVSRIEELNTYMINKLGEQITTIGTLTPTQLREVLKSVQYGNNLDEIVKKISKITNKNIEDIYSIFEEVAKKNQEYVKKFYEYKNIQFVPFDNNKSLQLQVKSIAQSTANQYLNISKTMAYVITNDLGIKEYSSLSDIYQKITDKAIISMATGRESFNTVMKQSMRELTSYGLRTVNYDSGYSRRLDSSVRMNINDGISRLNREILTTFGEEFGADGIEVSHHINSAPDHIDTVDGKQFSKEEFEKVNNSLERHVGELNCYHFIYPIVLGVDKPLYSKEQLEADKKANMDGFTFEDTHYTNYEGTQLQRQLETKIRQYKDRQIGAKSINDTDEMYKCEKKITQLTQKYKELSDASGLPTKVDRLRVEGYRKVTSKRASVNKYDDITQEWLKNATPNSHKVVDRQFFIDPKGNKYTVDGKNVVLDYSKTEKNVAEWLKNKLGGEIFMNPKVNKPDGIETSDYLFKNESWDLKEIKGTGKQVIYHAIEKHEKQAHNFIFDVSNSKLSNSDVLERVYKLYDYNKIKWFDKAIIKKNDEIIKIIQRKKK